MGRGFQSQFLGLEEDAALAGEVRDRKLPHVADLLGRQVLIGPRVALHRGGVHPALVGKGADAHVRLVTIGMAHSGYLVNEAGDLRQALQVCLANAIDPHLQLQCRDDGAEIGVAAAFPEAVDGSLHLLTAQLDRARVLRRIGSTSIDFPPSPILLLKPPSFQCPFKSLGAIPDQELV